MNKVLLTAAFAAALTLGATTNAHAQQIIVHVAPPAPVAETPPPPPHEGWVWQPGYQKWDGSQYVWVPGTYVQAPQPKAEWIPGHWKDQGDGSYLWVEGHWRQ